MAFVPHFDDLPLEDAILDSPTFRNDAKKKEEETLHFLEDLCKLSKAMADTNIYLQKLAESEQLISKTLNALQQQQSDKTIAQNVQAYSSIMDSFAQIHIDQGNYNQSISQMIAKNVKDISTDIKNASHEYSKSLASFEEVSGKYAQINAQCKNIDGVTAQYRELRGVHRGVSSRRIATANGASRRTLNALAQMLPQTINAYEVAGNQMQMILESNKKAILQSKQIISSIDTSLEEQTKKCNEFFNAEQEKDNQSHSTYYCGYLYKRTSGALQRWKRKYFEIRDGHLCYYEKRQGEMVASFSLLLTTVKQISETETGRRHCFEIITPNGSRFILQAESDAVEGEWCQALTKEKERLLTGEGKKSDISTFKFGKYRTMTDAVTEKDDEDDEDKTRFKQILYANPSNRYCADCGAESPTWLSVNHGAAVCIGCSGAHRNAGTHFTKVRSVCLDIVAAEIQLTIAKLGNEKVNAIMERNLDKNEKLKPNASNLEREEFIKRKYVAREFVATPSTDLSEDLKRFIEADDILGILSCIVSGVDKNAYPYIAFAVRRRSVEAVTLLILNGFDVNAPLDGITPLQDAANANDCIMIAILLRGKADPDLKNKDGKTPYDITTELEDKRQKDDANQTAQNETVLARTLLKFSQHIHKNSEDDDVTALFQEEFKKAEDIAKQPLYEKLKELALASSQQN